MVESVVTLNLGVVGVVASKLPPDETVLGVVVAVVEADRNFLLQKHHHVSLCPVVGGLLVDCLVGGLEEERGSVVGQRGEVGCHLQREHRSKTAVVHPVDELFFVDVQILGVELLLHHVERVHAD